MKYPTVTAKGATKHGYIPVTEEYDIDNREDMTLLDRAVAQFRGVQIAIVRAGRKVAIWRRKGELA